MQDEEVKIKIVQTEGPEPAAAEALPAVPASQLLESLPAVQPAAADDDDETFFQIVKAKCKSIVGSENFRVLCLALAVIMIGGGIASAIQHFASLPRDKRTAAADVSYGVVAITSGWAGCPDLSYCIMGIQGDTPQLKARSLALQQQFLAQPCFNGDKRALTRILTLATYLQHNDLSGAEKTAHELRQAYPDYPYTYLIMPTIHASQGQLRESARDSDLAVREFKRIKGNEYPYFVQTEYYALLAGTGRWSQLQSDCPPAKSTGSCNEYAYWQCLHLFHSGKIKDAAAIADREMRDGSFYSELPKLATSLFCLQGDSARAHNMVRLTFASRHTDSKALGEEALSQLYKLEKKYDLALLHNERWQQAVTTSTATDSGPIICRAEIFEKMGQHRQSLFVLKQLENKVLSQNRITRRETTAAEAWLHLGNYNAAALHAQAALTINPYHKAALAVARDAASQLHQPEQAAAFARRLDKLQNLHDWSEVL